jgi:hypothetical protein
MPIRAADRLASKHRCVTRFQVDVVPASSSISDCPFQIGVRLTFFVLKRIARVLEWRAIAFPSYSAVGFPSTVGFSVHAVSLVNILGAPRLRSVRR